MTPPTPARIGQTMLGKLQDKVCVHSFPPHIDSHSAPRFSPRPNPGREEKCKTEKPKTNQ